MNILDVFDFLIKKAISTLKYIAGIINGRANLQCPARIRDIETRAGACEYLELVISNLSREPYLLKSLVAIDKDDKSQACPWQDGFTINHMNDTKIVPRLIPPGESYMITTWTVSALEKNQIDSCCPWVFFILIDGSNNLEFIDVDEIMFKIRLVQQYKPHTVKARGFRYAVWYNLYKLKLRFRAWRKKGDLER